MMVRIEIRLERNPGFKFERRAQGEQEICILVNLLVVDIGLYTISAKKRVKIEFVRDFLWVRPCRRLTLSWTQKGPKTKVRFVKLI